MEMVKLLCNDTYMMIQCTYYLPKTHFKTNLPYTAWPNCTFLYEHTQ